MYVILQYDLKGGRNESHVCFVVMLTKLDLSGAWTKVQSEISAVMSWWCDMTLYFSESHEQAGNDSGLNNLKKQNYEFNTMLLCGF